MKLSRVYNAQPLVDNVEGQDVAGTSCSLIGAVDRECDRECEWLMFGPATRADVCKGSTPCCNLGSADQG